MPANFRLVADAAQTHAREFPSQRVGNRLTQARLAHARRPDKTQNRPVSFRIQFAYGQIFDQTALDLFEIVMIAIEDLLGLIEIDVVLAQFRPGKFSDRFDVTDDDGILRAGRRNKIEPLQFPLGLRQHIGRRFRFLEPRSQLRDLLIGAGIAFAEFLLDRLQLRAQISLALRIGEL